jgi:GNAT superfamily N-acetyltransferase
VLRNLLAMLMAAGATLVMAWRVDINEFSLNAMYSNRLIRCFLGASRVKERDAWLGVPTGVKGKPRSPHPATGFDGDDDLPLSAFVPGRNLVNGTCVQGQVVHYWGPTLIMNSAMNLVAGEQLAWQERKAESFSLGAAWCGAASVGYRATSHYATNRAPWFLSTTEPPKTLTLGRSMAISGAAANPNMGYHSSPSAAAFMTIFNVRLGWWLPNPRDQQKCRTPGPRFGLLCLIRELLGYTRSDSGYVNVSDGGHFDNLGIYELVRRRTRYIIASDAGADPDLEFRDLADVIRKCETDFGIRIEIELSGLRKADNGRSPARCAIGIIRYDRVDPAAPVGVLVYMKPVLTGAESTAILEYAARSPRFPHESTLDQFFSESQFESYRALGWTTVSEVFKEAARVAERAEVDADDELRKTRAANPGLSAGECRTASDRWHNNLTANLFHQLRKDWQPRYLALDDRFVQATQEYSQFHAAAGAAAKRTGDNSLTTHLYPELSLRDPSGQAHPAPARVHSAAQLVQIMENAWFTMNLSEYQHHPLNAGWMNALRRLAGSPVVREFWPVLRHEFSREFVRFAERRLDLRVKIGPPQRLKRRVQLQQLRQVVREFEQDQLADEFQWNSPPASDDNPRPLLSSVCRTARINGRRLIWTIRLRLEVESSAVTHAGVQNPLAGLALIRPVQTWHHGSPPGPAFVKDLRCFELVVWIRPAYRQQGIGTKLVETLLYDDDSGQCGEMFLKSVLGDNFYLVVSHSRFRHPRDRSFWKSFFSFYDFRGLSDPAADCRSWPETGDRELLCLKYPVQ